ncbi:MAG: lysine--tRNA ligase [Candidatus Bathyarchaeota archaeon]|nr:MAG: lysine--tRNA ligase [Candidatus Bathyarchaeota archaeon]
MDWKLMAERIIGHGTWYDKAAVTIAKRERRLGRNLQLIKTEMGLGASGLPHIGSFGDAARSFAVTLALREKGFNSTLVAFSDDKDGLRKVPAGFPEKMRRFLGYPVTNIPDPFKCHNSFGEHMSSLLLEALDKSKIEYQFISARKAYEEGWFNEEIKTILLNAKQVGKIVKEEVGQERYVEALPYFPVCSNCDRIYTTTAYRFIPKEGKVLYTCKGMEIKGKWLEGCGYEGEADYRSGEGKLSWKSEFAVRWKALDIRFEAYGKDIEDSVRINDRICREILKHEPPLHARYEMFLDKSGKKISKSMGNVFTPQVWFRYGSPQSLILLMLKRFAGTRELSVVDIPQYMNEFDELENIFFGKKQITNKKEQAKLSGLYKYCWWLKPPSNPHIHIPFNLLAYLVKLAPKNKETEYVKEKLADYGYFKDKTQLTSSLEERIKYAINWNQDFGEIKETSLKLDPKEIGAIKEFINTLRSKKNPEIIQSAVFEIARKHNIQPRQFFRRIYMILLGTRAGPRLGPYIIAMGRQNVIEALQRTVS